MIKLACCIPGGSLMPEGVAEVPLSPAQNIIDKCRFLLSIGYENCECGGGMLSALSDEDVDALVAENDRSSLKIVAVNSLFPGKWKLSDPRIDKSEYYTYAERLFSIMEKLNVSYAVFGSGAARSIPSDVEYTDGMAELTLFIKNIAESAQKHGVTLLIEPLRSTESNVFTNVRDSGIFVHELNLAGVKLLFDSFHMAEEGSAVTDVRENFDIVRHCHISEAPKRTIPGSSDSGDLEYNKEFIAELKKGGYDGVLSVESGYNDFMTDAKTALEYLKAIV